MDRGRQRRADADRAHPGDAARNYISFAELTRLDGFRGRLALLLEDDNLVIRPGVSQEAVAAIETLLKARECHLAPATVNYSCPDKPDRELQGAAHGCAVR